MDFGKFYGDFYKKLKGINLKIILKDLEASGAVGQRHKKGYNEENRGKIGDSVGEIGALISFGESWGGELNFYG